MPAVTLTATNIDANRITAAAQAAGYPDIKSYIVAQVQQLVKLYEAQQNSVSFSTTYNAVGIT